MKTKSSFWNKNKYLIISTLFVLALFLIWELVVVIFKVDYIILPRFSLVAKEFVFLLGKGDFYSRLLGTFIRVIMALGFAIIIGVILGIFAVNRYIRACLRPIIATIKSLPVMAITLIILLQFDKQKAPLIIGFLMAFPIMYNSTIFGIDSIDKSLIEISKVYDTSLKNKVFKVWMPLMMPSVFSGIETSGGMCIKAVISAEILCNTLYSVGQAMHIAKSNFFEAKDMAILFAYCLVAILLSLILELLIKLISKPILNWK